MTAEQFYDQAFGKAWDSNKSVIVSALEAYAAAEKEREFSEIHNEMSCCDDIPLDRGVVEFISILQRVREQAEQRLQEAQAENKQFSEILSKPDHYWLHEYRTQVAMVNVLRERLRQREAELEQAREHISGERSTS